MKQIVISVISWLVKGLFLSDSSASPVIRDPQTDSLDGAVVAEFFIILDI